MTDILCQAQAHYSAVGRVASYVLDGPKIDSQWGRDFPHLSVRASVSTQPPVQWAPRLSAGSKALTTRTHLALSLKKEYGLYMYYSSGLSWHAIGQNVPLHYPAYRASSQLGCIFSNLGPSLKKSVYSLQVLV